MATIYRACNENRDARWVSNNKFAKDGYGWYKLDAVTFDSEAEAKAFLESNEIYAPDLSDITIKDYPIYRVGCSDKPFNYIEVEARSFKGALDVFYEDNIVIYDADNCGEEKYSFIVISPDGKETKYFNADYDWYIKYDPDWQLISTFNVVEVDSKDKLTEDVISDRDWLKL